MPPPRSCARLLRHPPDRAHEAVAQRGSLELILTTRKTADERSPEQPARSILPKQRILIVDDNPLVRRGLRALIDSEPDLRVCAEAATHQEGLVAIVLSRPDLVIADLSLGAGNGLDMLKDIRTSHAHLPVLVLSMHDASLYAERAWRAGAKGYVSKQEMGDRRHSLCAGRRHIHQSNNTGRA